MSYCCMSLPIAKPKFWRACVAVDAPVHPCRIAISVAAQTPVVIVPVDVRTEFTTVEPKPV